MPRNKNGMTLCIGPKKRPNPEQRPYVTRIVRPIEPTPTIERKACENIEDVTFNTIGDF